MYLYLYVFQATVFVVSQMYNRQYCKLYQFSIRLSKWIRDTHFWTMHIFFNEINTELFYSIWRNKRLVSRSSFIWDPQTETTSSITICLFGIIRTNIECSPPFWRWYHMHPFLVFLPSFFFIHINLYILLYHNRRGSCPCFCYLLECLV